MVPRVVTEDGRGEVMFRGAGLDHKRRMPRKRTKLQTAEEEGTLLLFESRGKKEGRWCNSRGNSKDLEGMQGLQKTR